jgi:O-antigen ligase
LRDVPGRLTLERALQAAIVATILSAVLAAGSILSWLEAARAARWVALGALAALALAYAARRRALPPATAVSLAACAFVAVALVSAGWSAFPASSAARALALAALFVAAGALAWGTAGRPEAVRPFLHAVLAAVVVVAVGGLAVLAVDSDRAIQAATTELAARYQGLGGGPNTATMVLALGLPLTALALVEARRRAARTGFGALLALLAGSIVASGSRGALLAGFGGLLAFALFAPATARGRVLWGVAVVAAFVVGVLVSRIPKPESGRTAAASAADAIPDRMPFAAAPGYLDANLLWRLQDDVGHPPPGVAETERKPRTLLGSSGRAEAWRGALELGGQRPLLGFGFGTEQRVFADRYVGFNSAVPENSYIGLFLQTGAAGLALFLALAAALLARAGRALASLRGEHRLIASACAGVLVAGLVLGVFQSYLYAVGNNATAALWICAFLLAAATARERVRA